MQIAQVSVAPARELPRSGGADPLPLAAALLVLGLAVSAVASFVFGEGPVGVALLVTSFGLLALAAKTSRYAALALLGLLLTGHIAFATDFAKTSVTLFGLPLYVTEFLLAPTIVGTVLSGRWRRSDAGPLALAVAPFIGLSALAAVLSLADNRDLQLVLYQATPLFYYPLAALCLAWNLDLRTDKALVVGTVAGVCALTVGLALVRAANGQFAPTTADVPRYLRSDSGTFLGATFVALMLVGRQRLSVELRIFLVAGGLMVGVLLSEHRSVWLAIALALSAAWLLAPSLRTFLRGFAWAVLIAFVLFVGGFLLESTALSGTLDRLLSTTDTTDANADYRLAAWDASLEDIGNSPLTGYGFGELFVFYNRGVQYSGAPHNSIINITWYLGIPGLLFFAAIQATLLARLLRRRLSFDRQGWPHALLFGAWLALLIVACFNVILESPVGAIPFWLTVGLPFGRLAEEPP